MYDNLVRDAMRNLTIYQRESPQRARQVKKLIFLDANENYLALIGEERSLEKL
jgi:hypothetical protein